MTHVFRLEEGRRYKLGNETVRLVHDSDPASVLVVGADNKSQYVHPADLADLPRRPRRKRILSDADMEPKLAHDPAWARGVLIREVIAPLAQSRRNTAEEIGKAAKTLQVSRGTIYNYINDLRCDGRTAVYVAGREGQGKGTKKLLPDVESVITKYIDETYLQKTRSEKSETIRAIETALKKIGRKLPRSTIFRRIAAVDQREALKKRRGAKAAAKATDFLHGTYDADYLMQVVMIDSTRLDLHLVDTDSRLECVGRPYLTVAIDVWSRCILAFVISFDPPSMATIGEVITMAVLDKRMWMADRGIPGEWPTYGLMVIVHCDGGSEHDNNDLRMSLQQYGISVRFRPTQRPECGGHVERLIKTFNDRVHSLRGTSFGNILERAEYDPVKLADLARDDIERWVGNLVVEYLNTVHSTLGVPPIAKWVQGLYGTDTVIPRGRPQQVDDPIRFRRDFLPRHDLTVQDYGLMWDGLRYSDPVLSYWRANDRERKFIVRRDSRDISYVWFLDPLTDAYKKIGWNRRLHRKPMSAYEYAQVKKYMKEHGWENTEENIVRARDEMDRIAREAGARTRKAKRDLQARERQIQNEKHRAKVEAEERSENPQNATQAAVPVPPLSQANQDDVVVPFPGQPDRPAPRKHQKKPYRIDPADCLEL